MNLNAKELNFVGELAEKVSKAIQPQSKKNQFKKKSFRGSTSTTIQGQSDQSSHQAHSPSGNQSSQSFNRKRPYDNNRPFRRAPSQGKPYLGGGGPKACIRTEVQQTTHTSSQQVLHARKTEVSLLHSHSPSPPSLCPRQLRGHPKGGEAKVFSPELGTPHIRPMHYQHCDGLQIRAYRGSQAVMAARPTSFDCQPAGLSRGRDC